MSFFRSSWRAVIGASGLGLLVPGGLLLALAVGATVSGVGGLGADLRQVLRGPDVPAASAGVATASQDALDAGARDVPTIPPAPGTTARRTPSTAPSSGGTQRDGSSGAGGRQGGSGSTDNGSQPSQPTSPGTTPATSSPGTTTAATPPPTTTAPAPQGPVRQLGGTVATTARGLPVVGPTAADAVQSVVDLVDPPPGIGAPGVAAP